MYHFIFEKKKMHPRMRKRQYKETDDFRTLPNSGLFFLVIVHLCHSSDNPRYAL